MIKSIKIKNVASYCNQGVSIDNLKKINFVYGANGCGKTTVSNFLIEQANPIYSDSSLGWKDEMQIELLVYNKKFRDDNFGRGEINGVFTLGQASLEEIENITRKKEYLEDRKKFRSERQRSLNNLFQDKNDLNSIFKDHAWQFGYKKYERILKEAFRGHIGDKESFKKKLLNEYQSNQSEIHTLDIITKKAESIFSKQAPTNTLRLTKISPENLYEIEKNNIWGSNIVGRSDVKISSLINHLNISDWVNEGRNYISPHTETCPFCQQNTIDFLFKDELERFFDLSFTNDLNILKDSAEQYNRTVEIVVNRLNLILQTFKDSNFPLNADLFASNLKTIDSKFRVNMEKIRSKLKEPSRSIAILSLQSEFDEINKIIDDTNILIDENNSLVVNYNSERDKLIGESWKFICTELNANIKSYVGKEKGLSLGIKHLEDDVKSLTQQCKQLTDEIVTLGKDVTSVQPTINQINKVLKSYGFVNFQIVPSASSENQYQIIRENGSLAESTLSEGEITFITFLYYLNLAKGGRSEETVSTDRILVIDDPISSLDSTILYVVSSLIKQIIKEIKADKSNIKQLLLLTHNVYFHKEVSFVDGRQDDSNLVNYYILRKYNNITQITDYGKENPIHSSYELLWRELKNSEHNSGITVQNTMRRIIENYFKILGKYGDDFLISKFINQDEREICRSLICWINDGSHVIPDDLFVENQISVIEKYFAVFQNIFIYTNHLEHYNMMMGIRESGDN